MAEIIALATHFGPQPPQAPPPGTTPAEFYHCGCCDHYHPVVWDGDCRDDANRFFADELDERYGADGWTEVLSPGVDFDDYIDMIEAEQGIIVADDKRDLYRAEYDLRVPAEAASLEWYTASDPAQGVLF